MDLKMDEALTQPWLPPTSDQALDSFTLTLTLGLPPPIKRGRKMPAKERQPHDDRIRQLYVKEGRPIGDVRDIINGEFNLTEKYVFYF